MKKADFLRRFGVAVQKFLQHPIHDELAAGASASRAKLPSALSYPQVATSIMEAAKHPELEAVEADKAWSACAPWWHGLCTRFG